MAKTTKDVDIISILQNTKTQTVTDATKLVGKQELLDELIKFFTENNVKAIQEVDEPEETTVEETTSIEGEIVE